MADTPSTSTAAAATSKPRAGSASQPASPAPVDSPTPVASSLFGSDLGPVIRDHCDGRLSTISWFRTDWQRGGALTGYATYRQDDDTERAVVVKLPVPPRERRWLVQLQGASVVPQVFAHGEELGGYDMAWVVMERLPFGPLGNEWGPGAFDLLVDAMVQFSKAAGQVDGTDEPRVRDYAAICDEARACVQRHGVPNEQRWNKALKSASHHLRDWLTVWNDRDCGHWCHGDIHLGNAMTRTAPPAGPAVLLDFAEVHAGHWIEDAVHLEHLYWSRRDKLDGRKICKLVARQRKANQMNVDEDWVKLAAIQRALIAMCTPVILRHVGDPLHVEAALAVLEGQV